MKNLIFAAFLFPISCMMTNNSTNSGTTSAPEKFTEMTARKSEKCSYLLLDKNGNKYESIDISTKIPNLSEGKKVWITFLPLRRMSVCGAQPIEITEVYKK